MLIRKISFAVLLVAVASTDHFAQAPVVLTVNVAKSVAEIQPTMWGIFFEDINFAADGGIYAELVKNRSFEFEMPLMGWKEDNSDKFSINKESGSVTIINRGPGQQADHRFARIKINSTNPFSLNNEGFFGMGIKKDLPYDFSILAKTVEGSPEILIELVSDQNDVIGSARVKPDARDWKKYTASIQATDTNAKAKLRLTFTGKGVVDVDMVSLFPTDTWKNRPGGLRADLVQLLYDMKPGFLRFPGGCIVEGRDLSERYQWKKTVGNVTDREVMINRWNVEFKHRPAPDYFQSFGLGFFEYFQLAEDIGASPLPILSCGMACQFNTAEVVPLDQIDPYVQDALDLIEFANGDISTRWGKLRADMGHPKTFNLKLIGVGNEQWGTQYIERYKIFANAIKSKYPDVKIVSGTGPFPDGELFDYAASELKQLNADIVDEHYYRAPEWFLENTTRYDRYDRKGPKIFAGEYAAQNVATTSPDNKNTWQCALAEAAFMTGLERNADVVYLASYAPLFAHAEGWQWTPDLIWFNNLQAYGTANYYVQKLFSTNKGTHTLSVNNGGRNVTGQDKLYASAVLDKNLKEVIVKVVNASGSNRAIQVQLAGAGKVNTSAALYTLSGSLNAYNTFEEPLTIKPAESTVNVKDKKLNIDLPASSFSVIKLKIQ
jgi:alpha-N-arabinofuranosidase